MTRASSGEERPRSPDEESEGATPPPDPPARRRGRRPRASARSPAAPERPAEADPDEALARSASGRARHAVLAFEAATTSAEPLLTPSGDDTFAASGDELPTLHLPRPRTAEDYEQISGDVLRVARQVKILATLAWPPETKERFFASKGRELPQVSYPDRREEFRAAEQAALEVAARYRGNDPVDRMVRATLESHAGAARMLAAVGTAEFSRHAKELYGGADTRLHAAGEHTILDLAEHLLKTVDTLGVPEHVPEETVDAQHAARTLKIRLLDAFPGEDVKVTLSRNLASKALAGTRRIRLRRGARYSLKELEVLYVHEGLVHMATTLNGLRQPILRCLGRGSPRTICLQEGLAVFAEFMAGVVNLRRLRRLADRVVAVDMADRGADFLEVYRYFRERGRPVSEAFECTRRVFRGGLIAGGAPFTKDVVYLHGAARVRSFFEVALAQGSLEDVQRLFVGKVDIADLGALRALASGGWIAPPRYMPSWARDTGLLAATLSFGGFFREVDLHSVGEHYAALTRR